MDDIGSGLEIGLDIFQIHALFRECARTVRAIILLTFVLPPVMLYAARTALLLMETGRITTSTIVQQTNCASALKKELQC